MSDNALIEMRLGYIWVVLPAAVTMHNSATIERAIGGYLTGHCDRIVFDLSRTTNLFSSGLGIMIRMRRLVSEQGGAACLVNVSSIVHNLLVALNLNKVFPIYVTDVEFEISQDDVWQGKMIQRISGLIFVPQIESGVCRINLAGDMVSGSDLSACASFLPPAGITSCVLDLSGLDNIDEAGAAVLRDLTNRIARNGGNCRAFGATDTLRALLGVLDADSKLQFFDDEQGAFAERQ